MPQSSILCSVDVVLLTLKADRLQVLLLRRDHAPYEHVPALPGGFVHPDEDAEAVDAAIRMLKAKTGIDSPYLEQLGCFSGRARDPRGWSVAIAYLALVPAAWIDDALNAAPVQAFREALSLHPVADLRGLPFDHEKIIATAVQRVRNKASYSTLPIHLCPDTFTLPQLQATFEAVIGEPLNKVSFRRKVEDLGVIEPIVGEMLTGLAHRPAQLYRLKDEYKHKLGFWDRALGTG